MIFVRSVAELLQAIENASPETEIRLAPGVYELEKPLELSKDVWLVGGSDDR